MGSEVLALPLQGCGGEIPKLAMSGAEAFHFLLCIYPKS